MRFFRDFPEALNELKRELKEMGIRIHTKSVQNKNIADNPDFDSFELQNYAYTVLEPRLESIPLANPQWCNAEFYERIGKSQNPGRAWELRRELWEPMLNRLGEFDYTYSERISESLGSVIWALKRDNFTRRAFLPVFGLYDEQSDFKTRIPCSLGYWFYYRQDKLSVVYLQRSADFSEHFNNDIWLAYRLLLHIAGETGLHPGTFSHWLGSLHIFSKDVEGVF